MVRTAFVLLFLVASSVTIRAGDSGADSQSYKPGVPIQITDQMTSTAKASVLDHLRDPKSAIFGKIYAVLESDDMVLVCGSVNAKNGFGGYTGQIVFGLPLMNLRTKTDKRGPKWFAIVPPAFVGQDEDDFYHVFVPCLLLRG
jgi:hypothetical protein